MRPDPGLPPLQNLPLCALPLTCPLSNAYLGAPPCALPLTCPLEHLPRGPPVRPDPVLPHPSLPSQVRKGNKAGMLEEYRAVSRPEPLPPSLAQAAAAPKRVPAAAASLCSLKALPDPASASNMMELGTIRIPVTVSSPALTPTMMELGTTYSE